MGSGAEGDGRCDSAKEDKERRRGQESRHSLNYTDYHEHLKMDSGGIEIYPFVSECVWVTVIASVLVSGEIRPLQTQQKRYKHHHSRSRFIQGLGSIRE